MSSIIPLAELNLGSYGPVPANVYTVRVIKASIATSNRPNARPTLRTQVEIIDPVAGDYKGQRVALAGRKVDMAANRVDNDDEYGIGRVIGALKASLFPMEKILTGDGQGIIVEKLPVALVGHMFDISLSSEPEFAKRVEADGTETILRDPSGAEVITGHKVAAWWNNVRGPASVEVGNIPSAADVAPY